MSLPKYHISRIIILLSVFILIEDTFGSCSPIREQLVLFRHRSNSFVWLFEARKSICLPISLELQESYYYLQWFWSPQQGQYDLCNENLLAYRSIAIDVSSSPGQTIAVSNLWSWNWPLKKKVKKLASKWHFFGIKILSLPAWTNNLDKWSDCFHQCFLKDSANRQVDVLN